MRPNNANTAPDQRFFFPINRDVEHHESLDTSSLPGSVYVHGQDHFTFLENNEGVTYAVEIGLGNHNLPAGATILGVKGRRREPGTLMSNRLPRLLRPEQFNVLHEDCAYMPDTISDKVHDIVQFDMTRLPHRFSPESADSRGVMILPHGTPLPSFAEEGINDELVRYRLLGFINEADKLVTFYGGWDEGTSLVDLCVANRLVQNRLEEILLHDALPLGGSLSGIAKSNNVVRPYLEYFDARHGTKYMPQEDPRFSASRSEFGTLTIEQQSRLRALAQLTYR